MENLSVFLRFSPITDAFSVSFYGLAADRQEYCFTKDFFFVFFLKFIFEPKNLFF